MEETKNAHVHTEPQVWRDGKVSGAVYGGIDSLADLSAQVYRMFIWNNPLHPDVFPATRLMEAEVGSWCCRLFNGPPESCATVIFFLFCQ